MKVPNHFESDDTNHGNNEAEDKLQIKIDEKLKLLARKLTILLMLLLQTTEDK